MDSLFCMLLILCVITQGESGPAGPSGAPGTRGAPVSLGPTNVSFSRNLENIFVIDHLISQR